MKDGLCRMGRHQLEGNGGCPQCRRESQARYRRTFKGKAAVRRYNRSPIGRAVDARYRADKRQIDMPCDLANELGAIVGKRGISRAVCKLVEEFIRYNTNSTSNISRKTA